MNYYAKQTELLNEEITLNNVEYLPSQLAIKALLKEVCLSPKPGLVDMYNNGSHRDMDFTTFIHSIQAVAGWFDKFYQYGVMSVGNQPEDFLANIRPIGIQCEQAMYFATHNVNTHKGGIFAFGLLLGVIGQLEQQKSILNYQTICNGVAQICQGIVNRELQQLNSQSSAGEKLFQQYQLPGARGEAESGYATVRTISLPVYHDMIQTGFDEETALLQAMLHLLAYNQDTNLVARGGLEGLHFVQTAAKQLIRKGGMRHKEGRTDLSKLDQSLIKRYLSPGGTADLIAITWFLAQYSN